MLGVFSVQLIKQNLVFLQNKKGLLLELLTGETGEKRGVKKRHSYFLSFIHCAGGYPRIIHTLLSVEIHGENSIGGTYAEIAAPESHSELGGDLAKTFNTVLLVYIIVLIDWSLQARVTEWWMVTVRKQGQKWK